MKKIHAALLLFGALSLAACKNDDDIQNVTPSGPYASFLGVLNSNSAPNQTFILDADTGGTFVAARGTRFLFDRKSFAFSNGDTNVHGSVAITVREFLERGDMIYSRVLPVVNGVATRTAGMFFVTATQSNRTVAIRSGKPFVAFLPQRNLNVDENGLQPYFGSIYDENVSLVRWGGATRFAGSLRTAVDTVAMAVDTFGFHMPAAATDFFDISGASRPEDISTFKFNLTGPGGIAEGNSYLFLLPKGIRQVIPLGAAGNTLKNTEYKAIVGREFNLVGMAVVNGNFYGTLFTGKVEAGKNYSVNVALTDPVTFRTAINQLL